MIITELVSLEQVLMRSMKTSGGLTRGRGMTEQQQVIWSLAMPACAEVNRAMQQLTGVSFNSGEQNKDMAQAMQARDWKDTQTLLSYLQERSPLLLTPVFEASVLECMRIAPLMLTQRRVLVMQL